MGILLNQKLWISISYLSIQWVGFNQYFWVRRRKEIKDIEIFFVFIGNSVKYSLSECLLFIIF